MIGAYLVVEGRWIFAKYKLLRLDLIIARQIRSRIVDIGNKNSFKISNG
jgi:hypothetical protein